MDKHKIKRLLDFIPLLILTASAVVLVARTLADETGLFWKHYVAFAVLPINYGLFAWRHKIGILGLGLTLLIGLAGLLSYNQSVSIHTVSIGKSDIFVPVFYGQPIFLLWLMVHLACSGRHYVGIATKKYWDCLLKDQEYIQPHVQ